MAWLGTGGGGEFDKLMYYRREVAAGGDPTSVRNLIDFYSLLIG